MNSLLKFLDAYTLRARLFPAVIAAAPALAAVALLISWRNLSLSNVIASGALLVLLFALADFARRQGLRIEPIIYDEMGGKPSITMMRRAGDTTIDEHTKDRYRAFLAEKVQRPPPTPEEEAANRARADEFYEQCGIWLRDNTRNAKKFPILFNELVTYGFRRNLRGLKPSALMLNIAVVLVCCALLWKHNSLNLGGDLLTRMTVALLIAAIHAVYVIFVVSKDGVKEAARKYARELILSCETLMRAESRNSLPRRSGRKARGGG